MTRPTKYRSTTWPKPAPQTFPARLDLGTHRLGHAVKLHLEALAVRGFAPNTIEMYRLALARFIRWCEERSLDDPRAITKPMLERYQKHLHYYRKQDGRPMSLRSQSHLLHVVKVFFRYLAKDNHILWNPASEIELPKPPRRLPRVILSVQEVEAILAEADPSHAKGLRDRAMLETLYSTGLRRMELCNLTLHDVDVEHRTVMVRLGKGSKDRNVPIGARAAAWVEKYLTEARPQLNAHDTDTLFVNDWGEPINYKFLATRVKLLMRFAGVDKPGACHLFRHAMATHMLENGADTRFIQAILGHANLNSTQIYTHVAIDKLRQIHDATHPAKLTREAARAIEPDHEDVQRRREEILAALAAESDEDEGANTDADT